MAVSKLTPRETHAFERTHDARRRGRRRSAPARMPTASLRVESDSINFSTRTDKRQANLKVGMSPSR